MRLASGFVLMLCGVFTAVLSFLWLQHMGLVAPRHGGGQHPVMEGGFLTPGPPVMSLGFRFDAS